MTPPQAPRTEFVRAISRLDATALVVGSMIGSGIFLVSADILRQVQAPGLLLLVWGISGVVTLLGALTYGELAAMFPKAGGNYVYLREAVSPLFGYLYGWTLFTVIQTGTIAAVGVAFAKFLGVLLPGLGEGVGRKLLAVGLIFGLTFWNTLGINQGRWVQNIFTVAKIGALVA